VQVLAADADRPPREQWRTLAALLR
jgi:hypothetical protein